MARALSVLLALTLLSGCAAPTARWNPETWSRNITPADVKANYPPAAFAQGVGGVAVVRCRVTDDGAFKDCVVVEETPAGFGFGEAALRMTPVMGLRTDYPGFRPGALMRFPVTFRTSN
ncbi:MAG TPA: energy transducer TonB [Brevundimonas sp.]